MGKVGKYHLVVITRKKNLQTYVNAIINLEDMKFIADPKNFVLVRRDVNGETPTANILSTGVTGNTLFKDQMASLLALDEDTVTLVILLHNFQESSSKLLTDDRHKFTDAKVESLQRYAIDAVVLGGSKANQPKHLLKKFQAKVIKRLHQYQGPVSMARCGIKLETFYTEGFMADKASPGMYALHIYI